MSRSPNGEKQRFDVSDLSDRDRRQLRTFAEEENERSRHNQGTSASPFPGFSPISDGTNSIDQH